MSANVTAIKQATTLYDDITKELSDQSLKTYNGMTLVELDNWRHHELPATLKSRKEPHLTKDELVQIMDWKLAKGKFRPTLPKLIKSNEPETVESVTKAGFKTFVEGIASIEASEYTTTVKAALKKLCELRGVGPATASLMLSLLHEFSDVAPPFFSDEAFMYFVSEPSRPGTKIKYNVKEYVDEFIPKLIEVSAKSGLPMVEVEKRGWALMMLQLHKTTTLADVKFSEPKNLDNEDEIKEESKEDFEEVEDPLELKRKRRASPESRPNRKSIKID